MLELPQWFHELATFATLAGASVWLMAQLARISRPGTGGGCGGCEHGELARIPVSARGRRSARLRVLKDRG